MKFRWTMRELQAMTNKELIRALIEERISGKNPYSPLVTRLKKLRRWVKKYVEAPDAAQLAMVKGAKETPTIAHSHHKTRVSLSITQEAAIIKEYQNGNLTKDIYERHNVSPGELYRVLHRHHIPLSRRHRQAQFDESHRSRILEHNR